MASPVPVETDHRAVLQAVKTRPRYRARMLRQAFLHEAAQRGGCDLEDVQWEFWARYGFHPKKIAVSQQAAMLIKDGLIERVRQGHYKICPPPVVPKYDVVAPCPAPSIFD